MLRTLNKFTQLLPFNERAIIGLGIIVVTFYCLFNIQFFPTGLTIGDTLVFVFAATFFGIFYSYWVLMSLCMMYYILYPFCKQIHGISSIKERALSGCLGVFLLLLQIIAAIAVSILLKDAYAWLHILIAGISSGLFLTLALFVIGRPSAETNQSTQRLQSAETQTVPSRTAKIMGLRPQNVVRLFLVLVGILLPALLGHALTNLFIEGSIAKMGLSRKHVSLVLDDQNYHALKSAAEAFALPILDCNLENDKAHIIHNVNLLWHGVGSRSLVAITVRRKSGNETFRFELKSEGIWVIEAGQSRTIEGCLPVEASIDFDSYFSTPSRLGDAETKSLSARVGASDLAIHKVSVTGHADAMPVNSRNDSNRDLSQRRAEYIARLLPSAAGSEYVSVIGAGIKHEYFSCFGQKSGESLRDCLAPDRSASVRLLLKNQPSPESRNYFLADTLFQATDYALYVATVAHYAVRLR